MAQNFRRYTINAVGASAQDVPDGANFPTGYHTIISIRLANVTDNMIKASAYIDIDSSSSAAADEISLVYNAPIPAGSSLELIDAGSKVVVQAGDRLWVKSDTATSLDVHVSVVQEISS
jgi:hypothetical protein